MYKGVYPWPLEKRFCNLLCMQLFSKGVRTEVLDIHTWELDVHQSADITIKDRWTEKKNLVWDNLPIVFLFRHLPWKSVINILHNDNNANVHHLSDMRTEAKLSKVQWEQNCSKNKGFPDSHFPLFSVTSFPLLSFVKRRRNKQQRWVQTNTFSQLDHNNVLKSL